MSQRRMTWSGVAMMLLGVLMTALLAGSALSQFDLSVSTALIERRSPMLTTVAQGITFLGSARALVSLTVLVALILIVRRRPMPALLVVGSMLTSWLLTVYLKSAIGRVRPDPGDVLGTISNSGAFPSGHTLNSAVFLGVIAGIVLTTVRSVAWRTAVVVTTLTLALAIGVSRVYLAYHWPSDVLGGWSLATAILGAALLLSVALQRQRAHLKN